MTFTLTHEETATRLGAGMHKALAVIERLETEEGETHEEALAFGRALLADRAVGLKVGELRAYLKVEHGIRIPGAKKAELIGAVLEVMLP